jgi:hypothetical protein
MAHTTVGDTEAVLSAERQSIIELLMTSAAPTVADSAFWSTVGGRHAARIVRENNFDPNGISGDPSESAVPMVLSPAEQQIARIRAVVDAWAEPADVPPSQFSRGLDEGVDAVLAELRDILDSSEVAEPPKFDEDRLGKSIHEALIIEWYGKHEPHPAARDSDSDVGHKARRIAKHVVSSQKKD